ncbi:MAG: chemotaxis protein CheA [Burkholderiaceae bacterium]
MSADDDIIAAAREGFLEEARDNLHLFERSLLAMEQEGADGDAVHGAFRAAHTIKGTAGLFGYAGIVGFTHEVESVLDAMRESRLGGSDEAMALLLASRDQIERLLDAIAGGASDAEVDEVSASLGARLRALRGATADAGASTAKGAAETPAAAAAAATGEWHISLRVGSDALRHGLDPMSFIRYLDTIGQVAGIRLLTEAVPALAALDPEGCHLGFEIRLRTGATREAIEQVFEFLREDCDLALLPPEADGPAYEALLAQRAGDAAAREALLAHWQALAGPAAKPFIERRAEAAPADRRHNEPERRGGPKDRRGDESRFIRVRADKLDTLIDLIGELVIASSGAQMVAQAESSPRFGEAAQRIHDLVQQARDGALGLRMVPVGETFSRFHRVVRDVSKELGKTVDLQITGGDTELDKSMVETIADPLMHLVRNSLDHGLEPSAERQAAGKSAQGHLALHAYHESGSVIIEVSDDGRGLNRERILAKAVERGLVAADVQLDDDQVHQLIFEPGFSTAEQVTNLSGRGVGMDVVRRNVDALRGQIKIASQAGTGTTVQIRLPLTLAIIDGFLTSVGGVSYVLPLELVAECLGVPRECEAEPERVVGHFDLRGEVLPYLDLGRFYRHAHTSARDAGGRRSLVLVKDGASRVGLVVDRLLGEHQTVIKPLGPAFAHLRGLAGSTILGSGEVALIVDVPALLELVSDHGAAQRPGARAHN